MKKIDPAVRVAVLEVNALAREGLAGLLAAEKGLVCVGSYSSCEEALRKFSADRPAFLFMDIIQPASSAMSDLKRLKEECLSLKIIVLTESADMDAILGAFHAGASGYLLKNSSFLELILAIQTASQGGVPMSNPIAHKVVEMIQQIRPVRHAVCSEPLRQLSDRESEVLAHLSNGSPYKEIADVLGVSMATVRTHLRRIYKKIGVGSRTEAAVKWLGRLND